MRFTIAINTKAREQLICEYGLFDKVGASRLPRCPEEPGPAGTYFSEPRRPPLRPEVQISSRETSPLGTGVEAWGGWEAGGAPSEASRVPWPTSTPPTQPLPSTTRSSSSPRSPRHLLPPLPILLPPGTCSPPLTHWGPASPLPLCRPSF